MKIFVFGAGASQGSQSPSADPIAPLVNQLFDEQYHRFAGAVGLDIEDLLSFKQEVIKFESLEHWLTNQWDIVQAYSSRQKREVESIKFGQISMYIWWVMQNVSMTYNRDNGYYRFIDKLSKKDEDFGLINFNYDTLLDRAYKDKYSYYLGDNIERYNRANYVKPHGSVNWLLGKRSEDPDMSSGIVSVEDALKFSAGYMFRSPSISIDRIIVVDPEHPRLTTQQALGNEFRPPYCFPLILMPLSSKLFDFVEGFHDGIIAIGNSLISEASDIYLIGYRAQDDIAKEMLSKTPHGCRLHVVGRSSKSANEILKRCLNFAPNLASGTIYDNEFNGFIEDY